MINISGKNLNFFKEQYWVAANFIGNYIGLSGKSNLRVLEVGSAEGGGLKYFAERGNTCYGLEYSPGRTEIARNLSQSDAVFFINGDITKPDSYQGQIDEQMDVVVCCDVIEHIDSSQQENALINMKNMLKNDGRLYISFPPKYSPFAGHQQVLPVWLRYIPFLFFLPDEWYAPLMRRFGVRGAIVENMLATKHSRISTKRFERLVFNSGLKIEKKDFYLIRPRFKYRWGISCVRHRFDPGIVREIFTLGAVYLLQPCEKY